MGKEIKTREARIRTASRHRREQEKEELRQTILKVAAILFLERGYDRFSMRQLAEEIGYSAATLYLYFRDKDELLFTVVDESFARFEQQLAQAATLSADPWERLAALAQAYVGFGLQNPVHYQLMFMWRTDFLTQVRPGEQQPRLSALRVLQETIQFAMDEGVMEAGNAQSYSDVLWATMHGIVSLTISMPGFDNERIQQATALAREMVFKAFRKG
ncbi:TetR/AcrR family transcriptional regulator [Dictyobacter formicarum]|uniref:TetR family transcriptional regulator n=1 Tax=Dictyobacter formicarum TaxID=2778368 RepID=A0ABQ3VEG5_9CHLR|nr:TetR/AcrR family transcriptional regulator [Dictyobacter formicarum]GHO83778.1 TetR family transcriptional regulator [Dictyobacter formicarum]